MVLRLVDACRDGDLEVVISELGNGANPASGDDFPVRLAAKNGHYEVVTRLLQEAGVNPTARKNSAIRMAAANGHTKIVATLFYHIREYYPEHVAELLETPEITAFLDRNERDKAPVKRAALCIGQGSRCGFFAALPTELHHIIISHIKYGAGFSDRLLPDEELESSYALGRNPSI